MIGGVLTVMAWSYVHKHRGHIRVDVIYTRLTLRGKAIIDVTCSLIFLLPVLIVLIYGGYSGVEFAWKTHERFIESNWLPPAGPVKTIVFIGFCLFTLQCIARFIRDFYVLVRNKPYD